MADGANRESDSQASATAAFLEKCRPKLLRLEQIRVDKLALYKFRKKIGAPMAAIMTPVLGFVDYWLLLLQRGSDDPGAGITFVGLVFLWGWVSAPKRQYARAYKKEILPEIASLFGNFTYDVKGKIPMDVLKPSRIMPNHTRYVSEDYFEGEYKGVNIHFSEIRLKRKSGKSTVTVFSGLAVLLTRGTRKFHGHTILVKDKSAVGGWLKKQTSKLKRANLVDPEFERLFDVYTNDQVEARYLIDPLIVENLKTLYSEYNGDKMLAAFYDDHFLILVGSHKNHFEPATIYVPATDETELLSMHREVGQILSIVDRLSLLDPSQKRRMERQEKLS